MWGSKKAGKTIRQEDVPHLKPVTAALGAGAGGLVTAHLLEFELGPYEHAVDEYVEAWQGASFPGTLAQLENRDLVSFLSGEGGWDRTRTRWQAVGLWTGPTSGTGRRALRAPVEVWLPRLDSNQEPSD